MRFETLKRIQDALDFIRAGKLDGLACGRYELFDGMAVNISQYQTKEDGLFEAHRKYIDIQHILEGSEAIEVADVQDLSITQEYDEQTDLVLGIADGKRYILTAGQTMVLFPEEAHKPGIHAGESGSVKKAVIKVPLT